MSYQNELSGIPHHAKSNLARGNGCDQTGARSAERRNLYGEPRYPKQSLSGVEPIDEPAFRESVGKVRITDGNGSRIIKIAADPDTNLSVPGQILPPFPALGSINIEFSINYG